MHTAPDRRRSSLKCAIAISLSGVVLVVSSCTNEQVLGWLGLSPSIVDQSGPSLECAIHADFLLTPPMRFDAPAYLSVAVVFGWFATIAICAQASLVGNCAGTTCSRYLVNMGPHVDLWLPLQEADCVRTEESGSCISKHHLHQLKHRHTYQGSNVNVVEVCSTRQNYDAFALS